MRWTSEELKNCLNHCREEGPGCTDCPSCGNPSCLETMAGDAADYIITLEEENAKLKAQLKELRPLATEPIPENAFPSDEEDFLSEEERCVGEYVGPEEAGL